MCLAQGPLRSLELDGHLVSETLCLRVCYKPRLLQLNVDLKPIDMAPFIRFLSVPKTEIQSS